uniref:SFRICE_036761 n=1 Tax=Spodoptera frugiperda TaxID=7108 RepID=A0A2H1VNL2_SPOFR
MRQEDIIDCTYWLGGWATNCRAKCCRCSRAMLANRISYWLGVTGPSYTVDSACSSSLYALEHAFRAIRDGHCDAAIVGGSNLCLHPYVSLQFSRLGVLSPDGRCKSFDNSANGYARSEAIVVVFLQKAKDSRRVYAQLLHAKTNCDGYKEQGITYPAGHIQKLLLREFYEECSIPPSILEFVEAHGTGMLTLIFINQKRFSIPTKCPEIST